jgi:TatD DNase family protein
MPKMLVRTAKFLAEMLEMPLDDLSVQLWKNSSKVFNLPE